MAKQSIIPFGPQHPVLPEPIHLDLVLEDEKVEILSVKEKELLMSFRKLPENKQKALLNLIER